MAFFAFLVCGEDFIATSRGQIFPNAPFQNIWSNPLQLTDQERADLQEVEVPFKDEKQFGEQVFSQFELSMKDQKVAIVSHGRDVRYLSELVDRIKPLMKNANRYPRVRVYLIATSEIDAASIPGGTLVFTRGLLEFVENEAALVGIVGHELSHLDRRHQLKPLQQQRLLQKQTTGRNSSAVLDPSKFFQLGKVSMASLHSMHPEEEVQADEDAVRWMHRLGYDSIQLSKLFDRLRLTAGDRAELMPAFFRTHPLMRDRAASIANLTSQLQEKEPQENPIVGKAAFVDRSAAKLP